MQEEPRRTQEAREERRAQGAGEEEPKAFEERRGQEREVEAQGEHESEVKAQGWQEEETNSVHEESHVSNRHMTWWRNAWWICVDLGPHMCCARDRRKTWEAARQEAEQVCYEDWVKKTRGRDGEKGRQKREGRFQQQQRQQGRQEQQRIGTIAIEIAFQPMLPANGASLQDGRITAVQQEPN